MAKISDDLYHCPSCNTDKPITEFYSNKSRSSGISGQCKECDKARRKTYHTLKQETSEEYRKENNTRMRYWVQMNPERAKDMFAKHSRKKRKKNTEFWSLHNPYLDTTILHKICNKCQLDKPINDFPITRDNNDGLSFYCKDCHAIKSTNNLRHKKAQGILQSRLGDIDATELLIKQGYQCAICKKPLDILAIPNEHSKKICMDHNHSTGKKRGLLCNSCNLALGLLKDSQEILANAIKYLVEYQE